MLCSGCPGSGSSFNAKSKITFKVVDENNNPLKDIPVGITFPRMFYGKEKNKTVNELTDINGKCSASGTTYGAIYYGVRKESYYNTNSSYKFKQKDYGSWTPNNPEVTIKLRKIENPSPMYARFSDLELPGLNKEIGFDLLEYDWIRPYGRGNIPDILFKATRKWVSDLEFEGHLTIKFPGMFNGIQKIKEDRSSGSELKLPRYAPNDEYNREVNKHIMAFPGRGFDYDYQDDNNYIFRIRTESTNGKMIKAMHGKIHGDIGFGLKGTKTATIIFTYYLNPDYSTNLEFDPKKNLFTGLKSLERPRN